MASETATWEIPYPEGTDELCDGYLYIQEMAERVDAILDEFDDSIGVQTVLPLARASITIPVTVPVGGINGYQSVDFDTANLAALAGFGTLTAPADSYYLSGVTSWFRTTGAAAGDTVILGVDTTTGNWTQRDPATTAGAKGSIGTIASNSGAAEQMFVEYSGQGSSMAILRTWFWVMKVADR